MTTELDLIVLSESLPSHGLEKGDVGTVVHVFAKDKAYEVEFMTLQGDTVALVTLTPNQFRAVSKRDLLHVRATDSEWPLAA